MKRPEAAPRNAASTKALVCSLQMFWLFVAEMWRRRRVIVTVNPSPAYLSPLPAAILVGHHRVAVCLPSGACRPDPDCQTWDSIRSKYAGAAGGAFYGCCGGWHAVENICNRKAKHRIWFSNERAAERGDPEVTQSCWISFSKKTKNLLFEISSSPVSSNELHFYPWAWHSSFLSSNLWGLTLPLQAVYIIHKFHFLNENILMHL